MPSIKVTAIGAGSRFTFSLISDLIRQPDFAGSVVSLVDVHDEAMDLSTRIAQRMVDQSGADLKIESTNDRREALRGSAFVLNTISVGEPWARERDVEIGEKYGIFQPTSQTVGPAGFCRGLRVIPHAVDIARDVAECAPTATVLNLANPLAAVCRAMIREAAVRAVGLCEQWETSLGLFAKIRGCDEHDLTLTSVGTNHLTWALSLQHKGREVLPEAIGALLAPDSEALRRTVPVSSIIYDTYGLWPTGTEEHIGEHFYDFLTSETNGGQDFGMRIRHTTDEQWEKRWVERRDMANGDAAIDALLEPSGEDAVDIIATRCGVGAPGRFTVNLPNGGLVDNLPFAAIIELPAWIDPAGVFGLKIGPLPPAVAQLLSTRAAQQELLIDAALHGDRRAAIQGLLLDAQVPSMGLARRLLDESIEANADWLPNFA